MDIIELDRIAVLESVRVVGRAGTGDWDRPTPCEGWTLRTLVEHMGGQHLGFAAAARGEGADPAAWAHRAAGDDPAAWYRGTARAVLDAFALPGAPEGRFALPEISTGTTFPGAVAMGFHFIDYVVHSWDAAVTLGLPLALPDEVLKAALPYALRVPDGPAREGPDAAFRPALPVADEGPLPRVLAALGRSPDWR
ncbi:TIGR03086 family metal-binding protein [Streptomyces sp. SID9727]|uniref:TIGR03086 family metal-binding protein n=1 Tax=Streptomyces sp. SID9727 TaxID=2706114 RepID=UPI0013CCB6D0|nr:TIGR03086 family metal-binding protein [Streptomyces sp. SID9727]NEC64925.1 TIGR03086 family protein [Streptomyces sp. SID9727]